MKPESALLSSQGPTTNLCPEPDDSSLHPILFVWDQFQYYPSIYTYVFLVVSWTCLIQIYYYDTDRPGC
jgi:hypothetical protein